MTIVAGLRRTTLPFALAVALAACGDSPTEQEKELPPPSVELSTTTRTVAAGTPLQLDAAVKEADGSSSTRPVQWESSDPTIATVNNAGRVSAVESGPVTITASVGGTSDTLQITAMRAPNPGGPQSTFLAFTSTQGDFIGGGQSARYTLASGSWSGGMMPNRRGVNARFQAGGTWWLAEFAAPAGKPLTVGVYQNAARYPFQEAAPGLDFAGSGRGCNVLTGYFTIHDIAYTHEGQLQRLHASFRQHCERGPSYLDGQIAILLNPLR